MSDEPRIEWIDHLAERVIPAEGPGAAIAVTRHGEAVHRAGYGMASLEWSQPVRPDTVFGIGSITKPFTATAIMLLERNGALSTAAPITEYLPDYDTHGATITLTHLLSHTSGIPNYVTRPGFWERVAPLEHDKARLRALFEPLPLDFAPGERYSYSNSGYCLLGMIIERVTGKTYREIIHERVLAPLGMDSTGYLSGDHIIPRLAGGYQVKDGVYSSPNRASPTLVYSSGALYSTARDLSRWDAALRDAILLDRATLARMEQPVTLNDGRREGYGIGWGLSRFRGHPVTHHAGGVPGYSAFFARFVEDGLTIIILSNWGLFDSASLLARPIAAMLLDLPQPEAPDAQLAGDAGDLARMAGVYVNGIGDIVTFRIEKETLRATGELTTDLRPVAAQTFCSTTDPDLTVTFEDLTESGYARATVRMPFYWYAIYRNASA